MAAVMAYDAYTRSHFARPAFHPAPAAGKPTQGGPVYYRQHEVIQLVEVSPPPPAQHPSTITTSSLPSSSAYTESCDSDDSEEGSEDAGESYCSSEDADGENSAAWYDDTYATRLKRIGAWRNNVAGTHPAPAELAPQHPHYAQRQRTTDDTTSAKRPLCRRLGPHTCAACDAELPSRQGLQEHARKFEACQAALEYRLEPVRPHKA